MTQAQTKAVRRSRKNDPRWQGKGNALAKSQAKALRHQRAVKKAADLGRSFSFQKK